MGKKVQEKWDEIQLNVLMINIEPKKYIVFLLLIRTRRYSQECWHGGGQADRIPWALGLKGGHERADFLL